MGIISEEIKNAVKVKVSIYDELKRNGFDTGRGKGNIICPFKSEHENGTDNSKSFSISNQGKNYKCYACSKQGDVINLFKDFENCDFKTAINGLAETYGIETVNPFKNEDPLAKAGNYLRNRGLDPTNIEFTQSNAESNEGKKIDTLCLPIDQETSWHRFINSTGGDKVRIFGAYTGKVYCPTDLKKGEDVFITESPIDTLSLFQAERQSISTLSASALPEAYYLKNSEFQYVIALDSDTSGHKGIDRHIQFFKKHSINFKVALCPKGKDWNDLLREDALKPGQREKTLNKALWWGRLFQAKKADEYFQIYSQEHKARTQVFTFKGNTYLGERKDSKSKDGTADPEVVVKTLLQGTIQILASIVDETIAFQPSTSYRLKLFSFKEGEAIVECGSKDLVRVDTFNQLLMNSRHLFWGNPLELKKLMDFLLESSPPKIRKCSQLGWDKKSNCFVFSSFLYDEKGEMESLTANGHFENQKLQPYLEPNLINKVEKLDPKDFIYKLKNAYGVKALFALGFWVSTLFSHLFFARYRFFPILSLFGPPGTGKSCLTTTLNQCFFVDWEGVPMTKGNTMKGELRMLSQKSSLVVPFLEGREGQTRFDYGNILSLYNRNSTYISAKKTHDNAVFDRPFNSALAFVWNRELFKTAAEKQRVVSINFTLDQVDETYLAWGELDKLTPESLVSIGHEILRNRTYFEENLLNEFDKLTTLLENEGVGISRIRKNHAVVLAGITLLMDAFKIQDETISKDLFEYVVDCAQKKVNTARTENNLADLFFESINDLGETAGVREDKERGELMIHLTTALVEIRELSLPKKDLMSELKSSDRFIANGIKRTFNGEQKKAWIFKLEDN